MIRGRVPGRIQVRRVLTILPRRVRRHEQTVDAIPDWHESDVTPTDATAGVLRTLRLGDEPSKDK